MFGMNPSQESVFSEWCLEWISVTCLWKLDPYNYYTHCHFVLTDVLNEFNSVVEISASRVLDIGTTVVITGVTWLITYFPCGATALLGPRPPRCWGFEIPIRHTTLTMAPLYEDRDLYLTTSDIHKRHTHVAGGIRTHIPCRRAAADLRLRRRGHRDRLLMTWGGVGQNRPQI
jgi:hypothetical protein